MTNFVKPVFVGDQLEARVDSQEVAIYGSRGGLRRLAKLCIKLADELDGQETSHTHLEDFEILTAKSFRVVLARFDASDE